MNTKEDSVKFADIKIIIYNMYQSKIIMNGLLACGIATVVSLVSCDSKKSTESKSGTSSTKIETTSGANTGRIAYVDMDTLQAKYEY